MDSHQHAALTRMFQAKRLMPWIPEHHTFIKAELAKLEVLEPKDYEGFRDFYEGIMQKYMQEHPNEVPVVIPARPKAEKVEELPTDEPPVETPVKKKRGRPAKVS